MLLSALLVTVAVCCAHALYANLCPINGPVVAYVLGSESTVATTYLLACGAGVVQTTGWQYRCDFVQPYTLIQGPTTMAYNYTGLGGIGSATASQACEIMGTTYVQCTVTGGVRDISGVSTNIVQVYAPGTVTWIGSQAAMLFSHVFIVQDTASLLTYTPAGATVTGLTSVTIDFAASSTAFGNSDSLITAPPTGTPTTSTGASQGGAGHEKTYLWRVFGSVIAVFAVLSGL